MFPQNKPSQQTFDTCDCFYSLQWRLFFFKCKTCTLLADYEKLIWPTSPAHILPLSDLPFQYSICGKTKGVHQQCIFMVTYFTWLFFYLKVNTNLAGLKGTREWKEGVNVTRSQKKALFPPCVWEHHLSYLKHSACLCASWNQLELIIML